MVARAGGIYIKETKSEQKAGPGYKISRLTESRFFQQVSWRIHSFPREDSQLGAKCSNRLAYGKHFIFKPHYRHILVIIYLKSLLTIFLLSHIVSSKESAFLKKIGLSEHSKRIVLGLTGRSGYFKYELTLGFEVMCFWVLIVRDKLR